MIQDDKMASEIIAVMDDCTDKILDSVRMVKEKCSQEEFDRYKLAAGFIAGRIYTDVVQPLYNLHPEFEPAELSRDDPQE